MEQEALERQVVQNIRERGLIPVKSKLVVAVSGGADSVCLLSVLVNKRAELDIKLHVAHLNHQLRGSESDIDAEYVRNLANGFRVTSTIEKRDVAAYRSNKRCSLEEAAREVRYDFLTEVAYAESADCVAIGHTRDDNVETILMHILRGSGTNGLTGLQPRTELKIFEDKHAINVIRPLLFTSGYQTLGYCRQLKLEPRIDSSNISHDFFRNRIRHELLPILKEYNPEIDNALLRLSAIAADDLSFIEDQVFYWWDKIATVDGDAVYIDTEKMINIAPALQKLIFRQAISRLLGDLKDITADHIEAMLDLLAKPAGKSLNLPRGLILYTQYDCLLLTNENRGISSPFLQIGEPVRINIPGITMLPGWKVETDIVQGSGNIKKDGFTASFDIDKTGTDLIIRHRKPGDYFQPLGMNQFKKLQDFMVDVKIPGTWRDRIPLLCSSEHILWIVGWRIDERVKVTESTKKILNVEFTRLS